MTAIGVPIKILHEAEGHIITLETNTGKFHIVVGKFFCQFLAFYLVFNQI